MEYARVLIQERFPSNSGGIQFTCPEPLIERVIHMRYPDSRIVEVEYLTHRPSDEAIELNRKNCGTAHYDTI